MAFGSEASTDMVSPVPATLKSPVLVAFGFHDGTSDSESENKISEVDMLVNEIIDLPERSA